MSLGTSKLLAAACTTDPDCGHGSCTNGTCICNTGYVGAICEYPDPCMFDPCLNDGMCVADPDDGSLYCDCKIGYINPYCYEQDPCVMGGNDACLNGSTCKTTKHVEFTCQCRVPYTGEFCETYNLCEIDKEECIEDLNTKSPDDLFCYPCIVDANCTQITETEYTCVCDSGTNHSSCFIDSNFKKTDIMRPVVPNIQTDVSKNLWNPIIPSIALSTCGLYFLILFILFLVLWKRKKHHPRLIVCTDIDDFDFDGLTYYLISVETGKQWRAGTTSTVLCFLCGEHGQAGPYPINDRHLMKVGVLQRCQEDNYLVTHTKDLGKIEKVVFWVDPHGPGSKSTWFCEKITVKNIKTEENWLFYASKWIFAQQGYHDFDVAPTVTIQARNRARINCQHYNHQLSRHHVYVAPFLFITPERITLAFTECLTYMLTLIGLYGFISFIDPDFYTIPDYTPSLVELVKGSIAAQICFVLGATYSLLFTIVNTKRIPTLIVWRNKPGTLPSKKRLTLESYVQTEPEEKSSIGETGSNASIATATEPLDALEALEPKPEILPKIKRRRRLRVPIKRTKSIEYMDDDVFRVPSTDILKTENWTYENAKGTTGPEEMAADDLVHNYEPFNELTNYPKTTVDYGFIGSLVGIRQLEPDSFIYQTDDFFNGPAFLESTIDNEIMDSYELQMGGPQISQTIATPVQPSDSYDMIDVYESDEDIEDDASGSADMGINSIDDTPQPTPITELQTRVTEPEIILEPEPDMAGGDFPREEKEIEKSEDSKQSQPVNLVYCELCEMDYYQFGKILTRSCIVIGWVVCISLIITATVICCIYGGRYGYQRTYSWCIALAICWLENFFFYQFLKIIVIVIIITTLINNKKLPNFEDKRIRERFQVYLVDGPSKLPNKYPLHFIQYIPKYEVKNN